MGVAVPIIWTEKGRYTTVLGTFTQARIDYRQTRQVFEMDETQQGDNIVA